VPNGGTTASLHPDQARWQVDEESEHMVALGLPLQCCVAMHANTRGFEIFFCYVDTDGCNLHVGHPSQFKWLTISSTLAHRCHHEWGRPSHNNTLLHGTTTGSTSPPRGQESFAVSYLLALTGTPSIRFLCIGSRFRTTLPRRHRPPVRSFASLAVINSRWNLHSQECTHVGRTKKKADRVRVG
jgi:hypothetical protein